MERLRAGYQKDDLQDIFNFKSEKQIIKIKLKKPFLLNKLQTCSRFFLDF